MLREEREEAVEKEGSKHIVEGGRSERRKAKEEGGGIRQARR